MCALLIDIELTGDVLGEAFGEGSCGHGKLIGWEYSIAVARFRPVDQGSDREMKGPIGSENPSGDFQA